VKRVGILRIGERKMSGTAATGRAVSGETILGRTCECRNAKGNYKQSYYSEHEAEDAAKIVNDKYPEQMPQRPYRCDEGGVWHLTTKPVAGVVYSPGALSVNVRLGAAAKNAEAAGATQKQTRKHYPEETRAEAFRLRAQGLPHADIALRLGVLDRQTVSNWLNNPAYKQRYGNGRSVTSTTVEQIESEEQALERKLAELKTKKQALIDAKALKFLPCTVGVNTPGVLIKKEGNTLALSIEDAETLVVRLDDYLKGLSA
jgi:transposase-like protein